uniref:EGF-like domain-containing protein n=1 Tax=Panagrellus redivivus TaxID=6233 RepID=A0A7E4VVX4_PANRE
MPGFPSPLLYILFLTFCVQLTISAKNSDSIYDDEDDSVVLRCDPMCDTGYLCERRNGKGVCIFAKSLIAIIVILSLLGLIAFAAGITIFAFCFCAAFHQEGLNRIIRKNPSQVEREKKRNDRKKRPISATYFDDELQKRRAAADYASLETSGTTIQSAYAMGPPPPPPRTPAEVDTPGQMPLTPAASPPHSVFIVDGLDGEKQNGSAKTTGKTPSNKSVKSEDTV